MHRKWISFLIILAALIICHPTDKAYALPEDELNIYAMYLDCDVKGDCVLLESKGSYLLIDIGTSEYAPAIIRQLNQLGVKHVDIMFSHLHTDHIGAKGQDITSGLEQLSDGGIIIDRLYLPSRKLTDKSLAYPARYDALEAYIRSVRGKVVYLNTGDRLTVGDAKGQVVGPLDTPYVTPEYFAQSPEELEVGNSTAYVDYENNRSLAVIFTCGSKRYFTAGDCYRDEADSLVQKYRDELRCDIMKANHHGIGNGNTSGLISSIQPSYSFALNAGATQVSETSDNWRTYAYMKFASKYGMCYLLGLEKKTIIYHIADDKITLYQGDTVSEQNKMTGWQYLYGSDGTNRDHDMFYFDEDGMPVSGIKTIDKHSYYFDSTGKMMYGTFDDFGEYNGWVSFPDGMRYFAWSDDKKYSYMYCNGFTFVNGTLYYFYEDGRKMKYTGPEAPALVTIGSSQYAMNFNGSMLTDSWADIDNNLYYFGKNGKMYRDGIYKIEGSKYYFNELGIMQTELLIEINDNNYYFNKLGIMQAKKVVTLGGKKYYFNNLGAMVTNKLVKVGGKKYYFDGQGVMQTKKLIKIGKGKYYFDKLGVMQVNKLVKIGGKKYYFGKNGKMKTNCDVEYKGKSYHCDSNGVAKLLPKKEESKKEAS